MTADVQRVLAEALTGRVPVFAFRRENPDIDVIAAALLPTVQALIADAEKRAAAQALRDAADWLALDPQAGGAPPTTRQGTTLPEHIVALAGTTWAIESIEDRAAALDPAGAADEAQTPCPDCGSTGPLHDGDVHDPLGIR